MPDEWDSTAKPKGPKEGGGEPAGEEEGKGKPE
jgi:hypothetical protein